MVLKTSWPHVRRLCIQFILVQASIWLVSLPILISWGLPVSIISPLGNLLFSPLFFIFLLLCALIFVTELMYLPNAWLITLLSHLQSIIDLCMSYGSPSWLIGFALPHPLVFVLFIFICFFILLSRLQLMHKSLLLFGIIMSMSTVLKVITPTQNSILTLVGKKTIRIEKNDRGITLYDEGVFSTRILSSSFVKFTLLKELILQTGATHIDHIYVRIQTAHTYDNLATLIQESSIGTIHLGPIKLENKQQERAFKWFYKNLKQGQVSLRRHRINPYDSQVQSILPS